MVKNTYVEDRSAVKLDTHHMASGPMGSNSVEQLYWMSLPTKGVPNRLKVIRTLPAATIDPSTGPSKM